MNHFLLTGCAGFIGAKTAEMLLEKGYRVTGIDNLNDYYDVRVKHYRLENLQKHPNFSFHSIDIENLPELDSLCASQSFDAVFNLAARAGVRYSMENPFVYMSTNATGTLNLLEMCKQYDIPKFLLASTSSLYAGQQMPFREDLPVNTPISPYAASKKAAEAMAYTYHYLYGIDVSVVRYFTVFGPAGRPDMSVFRFIKAVYDGTAITMFGDGSQSRDWTYVDDIARGTIAAGTRNLGYEIINLGGGLNPKTLKYVLELIEDGVGKKAIIDYKPFHVADLKETWADISNAKKLLDWEPEISPEEGIRRTVAWHLENKEFLEDIQL
jgi:UDP-glucuronate 4-epimerase